MGPLPSRKSAPNSALAAAQERLWGPGSLSGRLFDFLQTHLTSSVIRSIQALLSEAVTAPKKKERKGNKSHTKKETIQIILLSFLLPDEVSGPTFLHQLGQT